MKIALLVVTAAMFTLTLHAQTATDEAAIRQIIQDEVAAWNKGDADVYSQHVVDDITFTNLSGTYFTGRQAFHDRHDKILKTVYRGSKKQEDIVAMKFLRPDVALVDILQTITGYQTLLPGTTADAKGRLRSRLLQVMVKNGGEWKVAAYHNVDVKPGTTVPEPQ